MAKGNFGTLYLIPAPLGESTVNRVIPAYNLEIIRSLHTFVVEDIRTARRYLRSAGFEGPMDDDMFLLLNEHTSNEELPSLLQPLLGGSSVGLMSEAGLPCVADPGHRLVSEAQAAGIRVVPLTGPSSLMLALMASGLNGQGFHFHGYLPVKPQELRPAIKKIEKEALTSGETQIFIEAPYRNQRLLEELLTACQASTLLCLAVELTTAREYIKTQSIAEWKKGNTLLNKKNTIFLLGRPS